MRFLAFLFALLISLGASAQPVPGPFATFSSAKSPGQLIAGISLTGGSFNSGAPSGTVVDVINVSMAPVGPAFSGSLSLSGTDAASFQLSGSNLETNGSLACRTYSLTITATQAPIHNSPFSIPTTVTCTPIVQTITNVGLSGSSFNSGASTGTVIGAISVGMSPTTPAFAGTLSLSGTSAASFQLSSTSLPANLETNGTLACTTYTLNIVATQVGATGSPFTFPVTVTCTPTVQTITNIGLTGSSFNSGASTGTIIGAISVGMSPTSPAFAGTLSLSGAAAASFQLSSATLPSNLETNGSLACTSYSLNLVATQAGTTGSPLTVPITVTCTPPQQTLAGIGLTGTSFNSGAGTGTVVGAISVSMSPTTPAFAGTLSLSGTDAGSFQLSSTTLPSNLETNGSLSCTTFNLNIVATQAGATGSPLTVPVTVTCSVTQVISSVNLSNATFNFGAPTATVVGAISVPMAPTTPAFSGTLSLTGTNASSFQLSSTSLPANLETNGALACTTYSLNIVATQGGISNSPVTTPVTITCTPPAQTISNVSLSSTSFNSGAATGTVVGAISVGMSPTSPAFSGTLSLTGTNAGNFQLSSTSLPANLETNGALACTTYSLNVVATQAGATGSPFTQAVTITCTPATQTIVAVSLSNSSFNSGAATGTTVGAISVSMSPTSPAFSGTLSLTGTNAGSFQLSSTTLPSNLETNGALACTTFSLNIVATQAGATGSPFTQAVTVTCTPTVQTISGVTISSASFNIGAPSGTVIGSIAVPMSPSTPAFSGTLSLSGTDAASFSLSSTTLPANLLTVGALSCRSYSLNLVATQAGATGSPKTVPITITCNSTIQATSVTFTGVSPCTGTAVATAGGGTSGSLTCPTAGGVITAGTTIATIAVSPVGWVGSGSISAGTGSYNSTTFVIGGTAPNYLLKVGSSSLTPGGPGLNGVITGLFSP